MDNMYGAAPYTTDESYVWLRNLRSFVNNYISIILNINSTLFLIERKDNIN